MMGFGFSMMLVVFGIPILGIVILAIILMDRWKK